MMELHLGKPWWIVINSENGLCVHKIAIFVGQSDDNPVDEMGYPMFRQTQPCLFFFGSKSGS
jgi:hypothetical protein